MCINVEKNGVSLPQQFKKSEEWRKLQTDLSVLYNMKPHIDPATNTNITYATSALRQVCTNGFLIVSYVTVYYILVSRSQHKKLEKSCEASSSCIYLGKNGMIILSL